MRLSLQMYTVRDQFSENPVATYSAIKAAGLDYVEGGGNFGGATPEEGRKLLDEAGLQASGSHVPLTELEGDLRPVAERAQTLGFKYVILPWIDANVYAGGWAAVGRRLSTVGQKLKEHGLIFCYHNHAFEFENEGEPGLDVLYGAADPNFVKAELDVAWIQIGGANPAEYIRKYKSRLPLLHLKDFDPDKNPRWRAAGDGIVDWDACLAAAREGSVDFAAIELDESPGAPMDSVRRSVEFFKARGL